MARTTLTPAEALAEQLKGAELGACSTENHLAVLVVNPDNGHSTTVWLPDEITPDYIWGPSFEFTAPGAMGLDHVAAMVKASAVHW